MEAIEETSDDLCQWWAESLHYGANQAKVFFWHFAANAYFYSIEVEKTENVVKRFFLGFINGAFAIATFPLAIAGHFLTGLANRLQVREYTYWKGEGEELDKTTWKVCHLNTCMFYGFLPHLYGGQDAAVSRVDDLINFIKKEDPDIIFLCEFNPSLANVLFEETKGDYPHYFVNIGPNALGTGSSMCVVSRVPLSSKPQFIPTQIAAEKEQKLAYRGYFHIETPLAHFIYVHLHPKESERAQEIRQEQMEEIKELIGDEKKPYVILGDFNIDRFKRGTFEGFGDPLGAVETCRDGETPESIDALLLKGKVQAKVLAIDTYGFTDHKAIVGHIFNTLNL